MFSTSRWLQGAEEDTKEDSGGSSTTCSCPASNDESIDLLRPQTVQMLSMGGEGAYLDFIANRFRSRAALFKNRTGNTVETVGVGDDVDVLTEEILADVDAKVYDGYVFLPFLAGSLLDRGGLADLTEFVRTNQDIEWPDIFPFNREVQSVFDNSVRLLPCDGDVHSLYYRKDLFEKFNVSVPRTWDEYTEVAKFFHGMEVPSANATAAANGENVTLTGSCVGRKPSCLDFGFFNVLVHSTQTQAGGTRKGSLLDTQTFEPLLGEAMAETLRHLENQIRFGAPDEFTYEQCSGLNIERMNTLGNCAMTYHWGDVFARHLLDDSVVEGKLGISPTPGSTKVLDMESGKMVNCTEELCPHGITYDDIGRVNYAPYAAAGGWSVGVSAGTSPARQKVMAEFFGMVCGKDISQDDVITMSIGPITGTDPYRRSHFDIDKWVANGYPEDTTRLYKETIETSLSSENTVLDIRFPDADKFLSTMHAHMFRHLNESLTEDKTFEDRMSVARAIEADWRKLTDDYNERDTTVRTLKTIYQQSLSVYVPPPVRDDGNSLSTGGIVGIAVCAAALAALVTGLFFLWSIKKEQKKSDLHWEIKREDIQLSADVIGEGAFGAIIKGTIRGTPVAVKPSQHQMHSGFVGRTSVTSGNRKSMSRLSSSNLSESVEQTERSETTSVGYKLSHQQLKEDIVQLMKLRNPYIVQIQGAMIDRRTVYVICEYMEQGNLSQVLGDPTGVAGSEGRAFEFQWALQIAKGLSFLHTFGEPLGPLLHGDLRASNVLCDGSYNAKLSNFELESRVVGSRRDQGSLLWTAPEVLNGEKPSKESDVYSFGMLLFEIVARARPFRVRRFSKTNLTNYTVSTVSDPDVIVPAAEKDPNAEYFGSIGGEKLTVPEIITRVSDTFLEPAVRPVLPENAPILLRDLAVECWNKNPKRRPSIDEVIQRLSSARASTSLTKSLATRTRLFDSILPHHVQEALSRNEQVPPQNYDNVTVIFSDIVNFTSTSSKLTAAEVGDLISRLFTKYDDLAEKYGVKKLDVIGDAFLGVTNLPESTPDHAPRAAGFALEAISTAAETMICPSKPALGTVNIRFGLATGPVVASVIGSSKYPKFTLFGTTVNTASRMESSSQPGRAQCTIETAELIKQQQPAINVERRGMMEVKGRGELETFFLNVAPGKDFRALRPSGSRRTQKPMRLSMGDIRVGEEAEKKLSALFEKGGSFVSFENSGALLSGDVERGVEFDVRPDEENQ